MATRALKTVETVADVMAELDAERDANLRIWNRVSKTDPVHTKKVNQRGGFTAISAHYQVMSATQQFGPIGIGWGYKNGAPIIVDGIVIVPVTIWHGERSNDFGPIYGGADMFDSRGKVDSDAAKKAATDGLTKGLSQLGFNADVFLGRFDDNKYVAEVMAEFHPKPDNPTAGEPAKRTPVKLDGPYTCPTQLRTAAKEFVRTLESMGDLDEFVAWAATKDYREFCEQLARDMPDWWTTGAGLPEEFVPLEIRIRQKCEDLEREEANKTRENA